MTKAGARGGQHATQESSLRAASASSVTVGDTTHVCCCATCRKRYRNFACRVALCTQNQIHRCRRRAQPIMSSCRSSTVLYVSVLLPALVICAGDPLPAAPKIAPATLPTALVDAPEVAERLSDTYTLDAYVWRDSQPLIVSGE